MRVLMNATPRELSAISGDMSFYRDLAVVDTQTDYALVDDAVRWRRMWPKLIERVVAQLPSGAARRRLFQIARRRALGPHRAARPDVVLSHITAPPASTAGAPVIWSSQGLSPPAYYAAAGPVGYDDVIALYEAYSREASALWVWTQSGADRLQAEARLAAPVVVLPPACPVRAAEAPPPRQADIHLLFVGRDARRKGLPELTTALERMDARPGASEARWRLDVVGAPPADLAARLQRLARVQIHAGLDDGAVAGLMARADLLALPTKAETYGYVLIEAMAHGCALLTTDAPPMNDLARDGVNGVTVAAGDAAALEAALRALLASPDQLAAMGAASRARHRADFAPEVVAPRIRALYRAVAMGGAQGAAAQGSAALGAAA